MRILYFFLLVMVLGSCTKMSKILKSTDYEFKLKKANEFFEKKKYSQSIIIYEDIFPVLKGSAPFEDLYWNYAQSHYFIRDYLNAENLYKGFIESFPNSPRATEASFLRSYCFYKQSPKPELDQSTTIKAINSFQTFMMRNPGSERNKEAQDIIDNLRRKLEIKDKKSAELYYNLGYYKAAATAFNELMFNFPDSDYGDQYKYMVIKSYYEYARKSISAKQLERYEQVLDECSDFSDRFPESKLMQDVTKYKNQAEGQLKSLKDEQNKASS